MKYYDPDEDKGQSVLILPIKLDKKELEKAINSQLGVVVYEDSDFSDGLLIKATRVSDVALEISDKVIKYFVPLKLWVKKDVLITSVVAEGELNLEFETYYDVKPDWHLETKTTLRKYDWSKAPVVNLGIGNLNVTSLANQFIEQAKGQLSSAIDDQIKYAIDLKSEINRAWNEMGTPILISEDYKTWLMMNPETVELSPLASQGNNIQSTVVIKAQPRMFLGERPTVEAARPLPNFQYTAENSREVFSIFLGTEIPFVEAERITKQNMVGETFSYGKRKVKVEDINLYGQGNRLVVQTSLSGSYNGDVFFTGKPEYNNRKNEITIKDVDFEFSSKKTLMKTASWLFRGSLKNSIQENLNFQLNQNLKDAQTAIEQQLEQFDLGPGIRMVGNLDELNVSHIYISTTGINVKVGLAGRLHIEVNQFTGFN